MPEQQLQIVETEEGHTYVVSLAGELDLANAPDLTTRLLALIGERRSVVLDLSELDFIDSSGIAALITAARAADADGGGFGIRAVSASALRVLELTGVADRLKLMPQEMGLGDN